ncbi:Ycf48-like protein [subsurface metagenome]
MHSRVLLIGMTVLLITSMLLGGCAPKETAPTTSPPEPSPSEEAVETPPAQEAEPTSPASMPEELAPTVTPARPRPNTPFVTKEEGILFQEDFEYGRADGWALEEGWGIEMEGDNHVMGGRGHHRADPRVGGWTDYAVEANFKLVEGEFNFNFRYSQAPVAWGDRYFLNIQPGGLELHKQIDEDFFHLTDASVNIESNRWYQLKIALDGTNAKVYLDDELKIDYTDDELPIRSGGISLETLDDSHALFDDITVSGVKMAQRSNWVKTGGPRGGLGYDVRIHPIDHNIMFVTDNPSGVNKSYDGGNTWVQRNKGITSRTGGSMDGIPIFCLTIDYNNPNIVWAGTQFMRGIYKSTDGGETWTKKDNGITEYNEITFRNFGIHPQNSDIVFAGAEVSTGIQGFEHEKVKGKIYKTEDGGENWRCVWAGGSLVRFILINPQNPNTMYASSGIFDREAYNDVGIGVLKSTDGGETWRQINNGISNLFIGFLEMHPTNPEILFAAAGNVALERSQGVNGAIYRTTDGGQSWQEVLSGRDWFSVVIISPSNPKIVYATSNQAFYRSEDGGDHWQRLWPYGLAGMSHGQPISGVVSPDDPMTVFINSYNGANFKTTDGGRTWVDASKGYTGANIRDVTVQPDNPNLVYAVGRGGIARSLNAGKDWEEIAFGPARIPEWSAIAMNPQNRLELLAFRERSGWILRSTDGGNSWELVFTHPDVDENRVMEKGHSFKALAYSPSNPNVVYAGMVKFGGVDKVGDGDSFGIYKSTDGGNSWKAKNTGLEHSTKNINCIAVHPLNPDIAYIGTAHDGAFKTTDGGESWIAISNGLMSLDVRSLAIDPKDPEMVYAGLGEGAGIFKTTNGGELWEGINYGVRVECPSYLQRVGQMRPGVSLVKPKRLVGADYYSLPWTSIRSIVIDPVDTQILYAADFYLGVYMSTDGGESWTTINEGLSTKAVASLALSSDGRVLYAATSGEGVFRLELW